ncbi:hypothetical protein [Allomuricauda sp. CP2A]|jgi:predicted RNase H-like HicB family nuclease|uniref:hypothetical protein n=1 Tax=Allomuricauda sp. CP2A TaxID=1848189 RepID=UPI00083525F7|nr:hypothetical protein [Muricauda sp. CP2A]
MKTVYITIEKTSDGYSAYSENIDGIYAMGDDVKEVKESVMDSVATLKTLDDANRPKFLEEDYQLVFKFDTESLLKYYSGVFTFAAMARITGINQKQLQHYSTGLKKPREAQRKKIEHGLKDLAKDILEIEL